MITPPPLNRNWKLSQCEPLALNPTANKLWKQDLNPHPLCLCWIHNRLASLLNPARLSWSDGHFSYYVCSVSCIFSERFSHLVKDTKASADGLSPFSEVKVGSSPPPCLKRWHSSHRSHVVTPLKRSFQIPNSVKNNFA